MLSIEKAIEVLTNMRDSANKNKHNYSTYGGNSNIADEEIQACEFAINILNKLVKIRKYKK